jgi:hypothetical protein
MPAPAANKENSAKHKTTMIPGAPDQAPITAKVMVATHRPAAARRGQTRRGVVWLAAGVTR